MTEDVGPGCLRASGRPGRRKRGEGDKLQADLPPRDDVLGLGARHNPAVWIKHRNLIGDAVAANAAVRALDAARAFGGARLPRRFVLALAAVDPEAGVVASLVWGFPKGGPQGRWRSFAEAFRRADRYAGILADIRSARAKVAARDALDRLNAVQPGVGFASTSKIAYFAGLPLAEEGR